MWLWIPIAIVVLALAALAATRQPALRPRGLILVGIGLLIVVMTEALIRTDTVSAGRGSELAGIAIILLATWTIWRLPGLRGDGRHG